MAWNRATKYQVAKLVHNDEPVSHPLVLRKLPKGLISVTIIKHAGVSAVMIQSVEVIAAWERGYGGNGM